MFLSLIKGCLPSSYGFKVKTAMLYTSTIVGIVIAFTCNFFYSFNYNPQFEFATGIGLAITTACTGEILRTTSGGERFFEKYSKLGILSGLGLFIAFCIKCLPALV